MAFSLKRRHALSLLVVLLTLVAVVQPSVGSPAVSASQEATAPSAPDQAAARNLARRVSLAR